MTILPKTVEKKDPRTLAIAWSDGQNGNVDVIQMRRSCVCAHCVDEFTREPILRPEEVSDSVRPTKVRNLGRYALTVDWSDGHSSIFAWDLLRELSGLSRSDDN
jgi:DUF971 family protein